MSEKGRCLGYVDGENVVELEWLNLHTLFFEAHRKGRTLSRYLESHQNHRGKTLSYRKLLRSRPNDDFGWILPPLDHPEPSHCIVSGTGLTHLGSMKKRAEMHITKENVKTDSQKMFEIGIEGGKPERGQRGAQPEWFYRGNGTTLRSHNDFLDIPNFTEDGGEEPEIVGCYIIDDEGTPCRLGFAVGNEWSDHRMERLNYLWLAPSKLRVCAIGPELITDLSFKDVKGRCQISRHGTEIYDSGDLLSGENNMSHSLANLEDHLFKYPQFRIPGDVHLYFLGTMKMSFPNRPNFETGDRIKIHFEGMGAPLLNYVRKFTFSQTPIRVKEG